MSAPAAAGPRAAKRIGIDVRATQFAHGLRGLGSYVYTMLDGLLAAAPGHAYVLLTIPDLPLPPRLATHVAAGRCRAVPVPTRLLRRDTVVGRLPRVWRLHFAYGEREHRRQLAAAARRERLDVLHIPVPFEGAMFADVGDELRGRCRVVKTAHDLIPLVFRDHFFPRGSAPDWFVYERQMRAYRSADVVVAISEATKADYVRLAGVDPAKVHVVPNPVASHFTPAGDEARRACRERYDLPHPFFLFCSGTGLTKNRPRVIEAFARFLAARPDRGFHLAFAGPEVEQDAFQLKTIAFDGGLVRDELRLLGYVPEEDLVTLFSEAVALVTPSLYEGFGLPAAQAMATGTPVIAADRASHPEVVGDAGLLVDPTDVAAIAGAMTRVADDPALRAELGARGRVRARRFTPAAQAAELLRVYGDDGRPAPGAGVPIP